MWRNLHQTLCEKENFLQAPLRFGVCHHSKIYPMLPCMISRVRRDQSHFSDKSHSQKVAQSCCQTIPSTSYQALCMWITSVKIEGNFLESFPCPLSIYPSIALPHPGQEWFLTPLSHKILCSKYPYPSTDHILTNYESLQEESLSSFSASRSA